jgi:hypothetical protein
MVGAHNGPLVDWALCACRIYTLGIFGAGRLGLLPAHRARCVVFVPSFETPSMKHVVTRRLESFALVERCVAHRAVHWSDVGGWICLRGARVTRVRDKHGF